MNNKLVFESEDMKISDDDGENQLNNSIGLDDDYVVSWTDEVKLQYPG